MLAYFDCFSGISGDMTLGALIDLGVPREWLQNELSRMPLFGFQIVVAPVIRNGITAKSVRVEVDDDTKSRNFAEIRVLIENCPYSDHVKEKSLNIFQKVAQAEAGIHGCALEEVHFHELGGIDAIVDIVGTALCLENLGIKKIIASKIPLGSGFTICQHGQIPIPAPATLEILKNVPVYGTPTGAAILAALADSFEPLPEMHIMKIGYGAGQRDLESRPNLLRIINGKAAEQDIESLENVHVDQICIVETCIDDMNPELFGFMMERLFADGALDVYWIPIFMKKNRPGTLVQVLCTKELRNTVIRRILSESTTLGVRYYDAHRRLLGRDQFEIASSFGVVPVKRVQDPTYGTRYMPEYEVCRDIALEKNIPLRIVYETIAKEAAAGDKAEK
jgi:uncharacterized protein (TIGR00299 family) protein